VGPDAAQAVHLERAGLLTATLRSRGSRPDQAHERALGEKSPPGQGLCPALPARYGAITCIETARRARARMPVSTRAAVGSVPWWCGLHCCLHPPAWRHAPTSRCRRYVNCWTYPGLRPGAKKAASRHQHARGFRRRAGLVALLGRPRQRES